MAPQRSTACSRCWPLAAALTLLATFTACPGADERRVSFSLRIMDITLSEPIGGYEICVLEPGDMGCFSADADGWVDLLLPPNTDVMISLSDPLIFPALFNFHSGDRDYEHPLSIGMLDPLGMEFTLAAVGIAVDPAAGQLVFFVNDSLDLATAAPLAGVSVELDAAAGGQLSFLTVDGSISTTLVETTATGQFFAANIAAGDWELTLSHPTLQCQPALALRGTGPDSIALPIRAGHSTLLSAYCD